MNRDWSRGAGGPSSHSSRWLVLWHAQDAVSLASFCEERSLFMWSPTQFKPRRPIKTPSPGPGSPADAFPRFQTAATPVTVAAVEEPVKETEVAPVVVDETREFHLPPSLPTELPHLPSPSPSQPRRTRFPPRLPPSRPPLTRPRRAPRRSRDPISSTSASLSHPVRS